MEVLLINLKENQKLKTILTFMNVKYLDVEATQYNDSLFDILNKKSNKTNDKNIEETILIMHEFSKEQMDMLLKLLRSNEIKIDLKCITTPHNLNWNIHSLYQELRQEKLMFLAQNK